MKKIKIGGRCKNIQELMEFVCILLVYWWIPDLHSMTWKRTPCIFEEGGSKDWSEQKESSECNRTDIYQRRSNFILASDLLYVYFHGSYKCMRPGCIWTKRDEVFCFSSFFILSKKKKKNRKKSRVNFIMSLY